MTKTELECPVFRPTLDEVRNLTFAEYVEKIEPKWLHVGICRIVAPEGWTPRRSGYRDLSHLTLPRPIRQHATGRQGLYRTLLVETKSQPLPAFREMANDPDNAPPTADPDTLERKFWKNFSMNPPLYGADVLGSLFDDRVRGWNLRKLTSILSETLEDNDASIPGVTEPYLYAGSWRSFFGFHTEDMDLHSVNYIHTGAPKTWYVVPPHARERFELMARDLLPELSRSCPDFLRHKDIMFSPMLLAAHNIPLVKTVHNAREFVVVGPGAYHAGFNHGFNIAESVNFATPAWVPIGARASFCTCRSDSVKIDMRLFADYMDAELAEEVLDSYGSDSEMEEEEEEGSEVEEESEEEENDEEEEEEEDSSSDEDESGSEDEEEELPAKRVRKPTAKAVESGFAKPSPVLKVAKKKPRISPSRKQQENRACCAHHAPAAARKQAPKAKRPATRINNRKRRSPATIPAVAHVHASSSDDESGSRSASKRGAAQAWYRLFDSLLPALKRARA